MKALRTLLSSALALLVLAPAAGAATLDTEGTGPDPATQPAYFCRSPFHFQSMSWNESLKLFTVDITGQCGIIQNPSQYMPGWGGGGADFKTVQVTGVYRYSSEETTETVRKDDASGPIALKATLKCDKNPWMWPFDVSCEAPTDVMNNTGVKISGPYPLTARNLESSTVVALREWEQHKDDPDPLADWDPFATPGGYSALSITSPTSFQSIPETAPSFSLALNGIPSGSTAKVLMNWQNIVKGPEWAGDIHLPEEARWDWYAFAGPPYAPAGLFPFAVNVNPGVFAGKPGLYRLQIKLENEPWWSTWRYFWIGPPQENIPHPEQLNATSAVKMKAAFKKKITTLDDKSAERLLPAATPKSGTPGSLLPVAKPSPAEPVAPMTKSIRKVSSMVTIESVGFKPAPLVAGSAVDVILNFKNGGIAASDPLLKYTLTCRVKSGGPCPIPNTTRLVSATGIGPGMTAGETLAGASPAKAGDYELTVAIGNARGRVFPFSVAGPMIQRRIQPQMQPQMQQQLQPQTSPQLQPQTQPQRMRTTPDR